MSLTAIVERLTDRVIGRVDAGACDADFQCCCNPGHPHYLLNCAGSKCQFISNRTCAGGCRFLPGP